MTERTDLWLELYGRAWEGRLHPADAAMATWLLLPWWKGLFWWVVR